MQHSRRPWPQCLGPRPSRLCQGGAWTTYEIVCRVWQSQVLLEFLLAEGSMVMSTSTRKAPPTTIVGSRPSKRTRGAAVLAEGFHLLQQQVNDLHQQQYELRAARKRLSDARRQLRSQRKHALQFALLVVSWAQTLGIPGGTTRFPMWSIASLRACLAVPGSWSFDPASGTR
jgi:hypothetical protein